MIGKITRSVVVAAAFIQLASMQAHAQQLSDGDYERCAVYDRNDAFAGYDSVCLERRRATLRRYARDRNRRASESDDNGVYYCPYWANGGAGYNATWYSDGGQPSYFGTFDSTSDGRPCIPNPARRETGYY